MLPKSYFGTFDMVLVDLSETVMSALVTKDLDIMSALSLLLKPEGIFVKVSQETTLVCLGSTLTFSHILA